MSKRITITLSEDDYLVLKKLSDLGGDSMSKIVSELVRTVSPILGQMVENLETVAEADEILKKNLRNSADVALKKLDALFMQSREVYAEFSEALPPSTNRGVRNSGGGGSGNGM